MGWDRVTVATCKESPIILVYFVREADSGRGRCTVSKNSWYSIPKLPKSPHQESDEPSHCGRCCERGYFWTSAYSVFYYCLMMLRAILSAQFFCLGNITPCKPFDTRSLLVGLRNLLRSIAVRIPKAGSEGRG
jgi:hypothetical protein